jgi:hypothetical protein
MYSTPVRAHVKMHGNNILIPSALGSGVYSLSVRNEIQKQKKILLGITSRPARKAYSLIATCDPIVKTMWNPFILQCYRPARPVTEIVFSLSLSLSLSLRS